MKLNIKGGKQDLKKKIKFSNYKGEQNSSDWADVSNTDFFRQPKWEGWLSWIIHMKRETYIDNLILKFYGETNVPE